MSLTLLFAITTIIGLSHVAVSAFLSIPPLSLSAINTRSTPQFVSWWDQDNDSYRAAKMHNIMRTDVRNFLTQRSLQSFIHLLIQCRDPHTVKWLEDFGGWKNLENFHGTGGLNTTTFPIWSSFFMAIIEEPEDVVVVNVCGGQASNNSSKKNPYLEEKVFQFEIDIDPVSLVNRVLSVREQIANEWVSDLDALKVANDMVLNSYNEKMEEARNNEDEDKEKKLQTDDSDRMAFDRHGISFFLGGSTFSGRASSPLRYGSFDLLALLATQESIHRVLRDYRDAGSEREVSFWWFREYYTERVEKYFDGDQEHGRADDFLEELLLTPPAVKTDNGVMVLVDPLRIAEDLLAMRSEVASEWKETVSIVKEDHTNIRKMVLERQMLKWGHKSATDSSTSVAPAEDKSPLLDASGGAMGAFQ